MNQRLRLLRLRCQGHICVDDLPKQTPSALLRQLYAGLIVATGADAKLSCWQTTKQMMHHSVTTPSIKEGVCQSSDHKESRF